MVEIAALGGSIYFASGSVITIILLGIHETDMKVIPQMDARVNEQIKAQFENLETSEKAFSDNPEDLFGYMI